MNPRREILKEFVAREAARIVKTPDGVPDNADYLAPDQEVPENATEHSGPGGATYVTYPDAEPGDDTSTSGDDGDTSDTSSGDDTNEDQEWDPESLTIDDIRSDAFDLNDIDRDQEIGSDAHPITWKEPETEEEINEFVEEIQKDPEYKKGQDAFDASWEDGEDTRNEYATETEDGWEWDEAREQLHKEVAEESINQDADTAEGEEPIGNILLGPPGAGKGWWQEQTEAGAFGEGEMASREFTQISSDETKEPLPEYDGTNAVEVHEEASKISKEDVFPESLERQQNLMIDKVATSPESTIRMVESLKEAGYDIRATFVDVPEGKSVHNATSRFYEEGRFTPLDYVASAREDSKESFETIVDEAGIDESKAGTFNNDVEWGEPPEPVDVGEDLMKMYQALIAGSVYRKVISLDELGSLARENVRKATSGRQSEGSNGMDGGELRRGPRGSGRGVREREGLSRRELKAVVDEVEDFL